MRRAGSAYRRSAHIAALLALVTAPLWALWSGDSPAVYAAVALLLVAVTVPLESGLAVPAAVPLGVGLGLAVAGSALAVLAAPYTWLGGIWDGRPAGVGLDRFGNADVTVADTVAVVLVALVAVVLRGGAELLALRSLRGEAEPRARRSLRAAAWTAVPALVLAAPMVAAAAGARWPVVAAISLVAGLAVLLTVAVRPPAAPGGGTVAVGQGTVAVGQGTVAVGQGTVAVGQGTVAVGAGVSAVLAGAGLAGLLPTHASTLAALGGVLVAGAVAGTSAREVAGRIAGWLGAVVAGLGLAFTAGRALGLALTPTAFVVLGAAAAALVLGTVLAGRPGDGGPERARGLEGRVVQAVAHAGAVVALLLAVGSVRAMAAVCTLWGLALGLRALWPGERTAVRHGFVVAAAGAELLGWWLLVADSRVAAWEAYTLPAAAVALLAGWLALRRRPGLTSWVTLGPALAAALLPTLASVLVTDGEPVRRLLLGGGALAVVLAGAYARLQAPVVVGGAVLAVVAVHEVALVWDLLPRWIPLALAGLLLVGLAMTLERRRRDLSRVRAAITRMS
jgi:hypothetical protein